MPSTEIRGSKNSERPSWTRAGRNGEFRGRHVSRKRLEETLGLLEQIGVIARQSGFRDETGNACACDHERDETND